MSRRCINKSILIGRVGAAPTLRSFPDGAALATLRLATEEHWPDPVTGEPRERTDWHNIVLRDRLAEIAAQYVTAGQLLHIEGAMRTRKYTHEGVVRYISEVLATDMQMLGGGKLRAGAPSSSDTPEQQEAAP
ncbi:single-stranded DNA-binding protein [Sinimarinibacterium sp. CAU 1509]|uniref:single-stranded DNA-binding protein n=1 Tax=Sinimarinibacterium sp. CAU 1509 TaxID=2562283 RepID=UPI0010AC4DF0|nr:single-stranded DNA-binding protein [Sinimarinibacterium sp. CAU 1509]TJY57234.1 single-stranded DNA-binding protein [Sinimarinibacterium sp. CAU 1509]